MFPRSILSIVYALLALTVLAAATPWNVPTTTAKTVTITVTATAPGPTSTAGVCDSGAVQCCNQVTDSDDPVVGVLLGLLGIVLDGITGLIGLGCSPLTIVGVGSGSACSSNVVCCENNNVGGLLSIGCIPIIL